MQKCSNIPAHKGVGALRQRFKASAPNLKIPSLDDETGQRNLDEVFV
jgi:hypothetical protein